jgi:hypothetical protein
MYRFRSLTLTCAALLLALALFDQMGRPANLTKDQISQLQNAGTTPSPENLTFKDGRTTSLCLPTGWQYW